MIKTIKPSWKLSKKLDSYDQLFSVSDTKTNYNTDAYNCKYGNDELVANKSDDFKYISFDLCR
jgi:hypothetical protein